MIIPSIQMQKRKAKTAQAKKRKGANPVSDPNNNGAKPAPIAQIVITFDGKQASVNGPIDNPLLFIRMMGLAMQMVADHKSKKPQLALVDG